MRTTVSCSMEIQDAERLKERAREFNVTVSKLMNDAIEGILNNNKDERLETEQEK